MLKHENLISRMTLEERIGLLISDEVLNNSDSNNLNFPSLNVSKLDNKTSTMFPSNRQVCSALNSELVFKEAKYFSLESAHLGKHVVFNLPLDLNEANISEDIYLNTEYFASYAKGIKDNGFFVGVDASSIKVVESNIIELSALPLTKLLKSADIDFVIVSDESQINFIKRMGYRNMIFAKSDDAVKIATMISSGATYVSTSQDKKEVVSYLLKAVNNYKKYKLKLQDRAVSLIEVDNLIRKGKLVSEKSINEACDKIIETLVKVEFKRQHLPYTAKTGGSIVNDVERHAKFTYDVAKESIIMLKNDNNALPIIHKKRVGIIGDIANDKKQLANYVNAEQISSLDTFVKEAENVTDFDIVGFAHGYLQDSSDNSLLISKAIELARTVDTVLVLLNVFNGNTLPQDQLNLISELKDKSKAQIVGIVISNNVINFDFKDKLDALLFNFEGSAKSNQALFDVLTGNIDPQGRLIQSSYKKEEAMEDIPVYSRDNEVVYPFGYGLSYGEYEYSNLKINSKGVSLTVTNKGSYNGTEVVQLFVSKKNSKYSLANVLFKGYTKVDIKKNETVKVYIPFDDNTFKFIDENTLLTGIEGGKYDILVGPNAKDIKLTGTLSLNRYLNEQKIDSVDVFNDEEEINRALSDFSKISKPSISNKTKIILALIALVYFEFVFGYVLYARTVNNGGFDLDLSNLLLIALASTALVIALVFIIKTKISSKKIYEADVRNNLSYSVDKMGSFSEEERQTFKVNTEEEVVEDELENDDIPVEGGDVSLEELIEEETSEAPEVRKFEEEVEEEISAIENIDEQVASENAFEEEEERVENFSNALTDEFEEVDFNAVSSINEIYALFTDYAASKGIIIEPSSARSLFAALASSNIVVINSKTKDLLEQFLTILNDYFFSHCEIFNASGRWTSARDLYWVYNKEEKTYVPSNFTKALNNAVNLRKNMNFVILNNVRMKNINSYFYDFIDYANHPTESKTVHLNKDLSLKLTNNIRYLVVPFEENYLETMPRSLANAAMFIDITIQSCEPREFDEALLKHVSYDDFMHLISDARNNHYLDESQYKLIDELEDTLFKATNFVIGNKNAIQIEKFAATYIECGGDQFETADFVLACKLLPLLKTLKMYRDENGEQYFMQLLDKVYGKENITRSVKFVTKVTNVSEDPEVLEDEAKAKALEEKARLLEEEKAKKEAEEKAKLEDEAKEAEIETPSEKEKEESTEEVNVENVSNEIQEEITEEASTEEQQEEVALEEATSEETKEATEVTNEINEEVANEETSEEVINEENKESLEETNSTEEENNEDN